MVEIVSFMIMGIVATAAMTSFLWLVTGLTQTKVDMVRALGSLHTGSEDNSFSSGMFLQFTAGVVMAYVYGIFFELISFPFAYHYSLLGLGIGLVHGFIVTLVLSSLLAEHHPVAEYQQVGLKVSFVHVFAHMIYGLILGVMFGSFML